MTKRTIEILDAMAAWQEEHGRRPSKVLLSPSAAFQVQQDSRERDCELLIPGAPFGVSVAGADWFEDATLAGDSFRFE